MKLLAKVLLSLLLCAAMVVNCMTTAFSKNTEPTTVPNEDYSLQSDSDAGDILLDRVQQEEQTESEEGYGIFSVDIEETVAAVHLSAPDETTLFIGIFNEDSLDLVSGGSTAVHSEEQKYTVTLDASLPQYYIVKGFLLNEDNEEICETYIGRDHTAAYEEFMALTTYDFDEQDVLNFDEDESSNFAVLKNSVIRAETNGTINVVVNEDEDADVYVIDHADETVKNLQNGNVLYLVSTEDPAVYRIISVDTVTVSGDTVTILSAEEEMESVFDVVKVNAVGGLREEDLDQVELGSALTLLNGSSKTRRASKGRADGQEHSITVHTGIEYENEAGSNAFTGDLAATVTFAVHMYYSAAIFGQDYFEYRFKFRLDLGLDCSVTSKVTVDKEKVRIAFPPIFAGPITIKIKAFPDISFGVTGSFRFGLSFLREQMYNTNDGERNVQLQLPTFDFEPDSSIEVRFGAGFSVEFKWVAIALELAGSAGLQLEGDAAEDIHILSDLYHDCDFCVEGSSTIYAEASLKVKIELSELWSRTLIGVDAMTTRPFHDFCFYIKDFTPCLLFEPCPNKWHKVTFTVTGGSSLLTDAQVYLYGGKSPGADGLLTDDIATTDEHGEAVAYFRNGDYSVAACTNGYRINHKNLTVADAPLSVQIELEENPHDPSDPNDPQDSDWKWNYITTDHYVLDPNNDKVYLPSEAVLYEVPNLETISIPSTVTTEIDHYYRDYNQNGEFWDSAKHQRYDRIKITYSCDCRVVGIDNNTFYNHTGLKHVSIPSSVTEISSGAFAGCTNLDEITIPNSVVKIGVSAFEGCSGLTRISIPNRVSVINDETFRNCTSLTGISIPSSVTTIGSGAFKDCINLTKINIPNQVTNIAGRVFQGCSKLTSITIPYSVTMIESLAFEGCTNITEITVPDSVTNIGSGAFSGCPLKYVKMSNRLTSIESSLTPKTLETFVIGRGITNIDEETFSGCSNLTNITIPSSVKSIGAYAFNGCSGLTSVTIPTGVKSIAAGAFNGCSGLTSVTIPTGVNSIGAGAFSGCSGLTSVTIPTGVKSIETGTFFDCSSLASITIPSGVTSIGAGAFGNCSGLIHVTIPSSVTSIGVFAFKNCTELASVSIPSGVKTIEYGTFWGCSGLQEITIPNGVTAIGTAAFYDCSGLESITIPDSVTTIAETYEINDETLQLNFLFDEIFQEGLTFCGCSSLTSITIPVGVTKIGGGAFYGCYSLASVTIPDSVTYIGEAAFSECMSLPSITIPDSVTYIGAEAFAECEELSYISLGTGIEIIDSYAFYYLSLENLQVRYAGSPEQWDQVTVEDGNDELLDALCWECTVSLHATGGECDVAAVTAYYNEPYGALPVPTRDGYSFDGWFLSDGTYITEGTVCTQWSDHTLNAHWTAVEAPNTGVAGDADGDGFVSLTDVIKLTRYIAGGWNVTVSVPCSDVNGDGVLNLKDVVLLRRFLAGGWGVVLKNGSAV